MKYSAILGLFLLFLFNNLFRANAQRPEYPIFEIKDSIAFMPEAAPLLPSVRFFTGDFDTHILSSKLLVLPVFDVGLFKTHEWNIAVGSETSALYSFPIYSGGSPSFLPFFSSSRLFHHATYRLNDKFMLGGSSFGANSIHSLSRALPGSNNWDTRGASMFMEYKVNRNFRIETRISVTGSQFP